MANLNWDDLRFFLALAREGTVSAAGRTLGVKHTTVARRISALEQRLASRLFDRLSGGYAMTQVAENLYTHAEAMESLALAADREVFGMDAQLQGPLKLTAPHDVISRLVLPKLYRFTNAYPLIDLELSASYSLVDLAGRQADIAIRLTPKPPEYLIGREVIPLRHGVYASAQYLKKGLKKQRKREQVILWHNAQDAPDWVNDHFPGAKVSLRTNDVAAMVGATKNHQGLALIPCFMADAEPSLRRLDVNIRPSTWGVWVLSHVDMRSTARVRVCREFLVEILSEQRQLIEGLKSKYL